jgi:hypothetical protein
MKAFSFWQRWLFVVGLLISVFGIMLAFFSGTALFRVLDNQIDPVFWGTNDIAEATRSFQRWSYGIVGSVMASWGIFVAFTSHYAFRRKERWAWNCLLVGLLIWFFVDTLITLKFQVYFNAIFNVGLLALVLLPLVFTRKEMAHRA